MQSPFPNAVRLPGLAPGSNGGGGGGKPLPNRPGTANNERTWAQETPLGKVYLISIDFGTTRSGIAWAVVDEAANTTRGSVVPIQIHSAPASSNLEAGLPASEKCDTILVMPDGGPDEIGPALFLDRSNIQGKGFMARDFKMLLDVKTRGGNVNLHETSVQLEPLSVLSGDAPKMPLLEVVSRFLKVAGKVAFAKLAQQLRNMHLEVPSKDQVKWVITVPAIWTDQARIFMREAALKAELITGDAFNDQVSICLEPEGAALHSFSEWAAQDQDLKDHKFAIIDLGGGTADITVHNVSAWAPRVKLVTFDEIHPPSGGDWGGRRISTAFENRVLQPLLGPDGFAKFKRNAAVALYFHLETLAPHLRLLDAGRVVDYETPGQPSRAASHLSDCVLNLRDLLDDLDELGAKDINLQAGVQAFNAARPKEEHISVERRASVRIPLVVLRQLFDEVLVPLKRHLAELFSALKKKGMTVSTAFLVGGLGSNHFVHRHLEEFHRSLGVTLFRPTDTGLAIVRGAVYFGRNASAFGKRLARTNYGLQVYNRDDPSKPRFSCFIKKLENLQEVAKRSEATPFGPYKPLTEKTTTVRLALYESEEEVQHTTDPRCSFIASIDVDVDLTVPYSERKYLLKLNMDKTVITGYFVEKSSGKEHPIRWSDR